MSQPLVTVGIPTHNRAADFLPAALGSALRQSVTAIEVVVSDNASTDDTAELVRRFGDGRVRYVRHETALSPNDNFNHCLMQARAPWFLLLHDDDLIDTDFVATCLDAVDGRCLGLVRTGTRIIDGDDAVLREVPNRAGAGPAVELFLAWLHGRTEPYLCSSLFRTDTLRTVGGFGSRHNLFQDVMAEFRVAAAAGHAEVAAVKASFRRHGGELTHAARVADWCEDARDLVALMGELAPERAAELHQEGMRVLAHVSYGRARRVPPRERLLAYLTVWRHFGGRGPGRFLWQRNILAPLRRMHGALRVKGEALRSNVKRWA